MKPYLRILILTTVAISVVLPASLFAQGDGPRFYWKSLAGMYAVPVIGSSMSGNANPLDPSHQVIPESDFNATMAMPGFARIIPLFKRSAMVLSLIHILLMSGPPPTKWGKMGMKGI